MNVNLKTLADAIRGVAEHHKTLRAETPPAKLESLNGFIAGLEYVNRWVIPALENAEAEEIDAVVASMKNEIEDIKSARRFGLDQPDDSEG